MLDDLTKEVKAQLYERARGPLFFTFLVSWIGWNTNGVLVALSDLPAPNKLIQLNILYPDLITHIEYFLIFPTVSSALFIILYPFPAMWAFAYWHKQQRKIKAVQLKIERNTPLSKSEALALRRVSVTQQIKHDAQVRDLSLSNEELEKRMNLLLANISNEKEANSNLRAELSGLRIKLQEFDAAPQQSSFPPSSSSDEKVIFDSLDVAKEFPPQLRLLLIGIRDSENTSKKLRAAKLMDSMALLIAFCMLAMLDGNALSMDVLETLLREKLRFSRIQINDFKSQIKNHALFSYCVLQTNVATHSRPKLPLVSIDSCHPFQS
ncbi:hypothetical protein A7981_11285 [Methylovorus sp. MM2]|uniref:hypothetical protein n=1 Tax=Methylovorus sp. MM2 TaxID=1848038 RepID=UPI0007E16548|nr:hypothetical protein [Methylovorus sp. MM2]OAM51303.1 hypothetical protein A7981_11285 [Methylovorus sp. MM2]